jgi:glucose-6-phosphate 1-dehydrogenase
LIGVSRSEYSTEQFREKVRASVEGLERATAESVENFLNLVTYVSIDATGERGWADLKATVRDDVVRAFYLSVAPRFFGTIAMKLRSHSVATDESRIVVEKPFGHDLASAQELNRELRACFQEHQIYRIDHYLGKETVQNLMALRFANSLFEPLWNSSHVDHVQITVAESLSVEGRGEYYDHSGAMRDMVQNHLMQLLCLTAMEPPSKFTPNGVRNEKLKVIEALEPVEVEDIVRGQYRGTDTQESYKEHAKNPDSETESFVAMKVNVANWRWGDTPFYLRTGKCLRRRVSEISIHFSNPPHMIFPGTETPQGNVLVIRLQPDEGMTLHTTIKDPGPGGMRLTEASLDMTFADSLRNSEQPQDAYERLIMDVIRGDQTLFMRGDEVEAAWAWADPIINTWTERHIKPEQYDVGSAGPEGALLLMHKDGRRWRSLGD